VVCYLAFLGPLFRFVLPPPRWADRRLVNSTAEAQDDGGICKRRQGTEGGGGGVGVGGGDGFVGLKRG
jgi:hypothetical protein